MMFLPLPGVLLTLVILAPTTLAASNPRALNVLKLIADVLYSSPANNDFIRMVENHMMDEGMMNLIEDMASKFAVDDACKKFKFTGNMTKRHSAVETPARRSANYQSSEIIEQDLLDALNSKEGLEIISDKAAGKTLSIPPPRYNSGQIKVGVGRRRRQTNTSHLDLSKDQTGTQSSKSLALMARVVNVIKNKWSRQLFVTSLDDGTVRAAMYNICHCNKIATNLRYFYELGSTD